MFKFLYRKSLPKALSKDDFAIAMLRKDRYKLNFLVLLLLMIIPVCPLSVIISSLFCAKYAVDDFIFNIIFIVLYISLIIGFNIIFAKPIKELYESIAAKCYSSRYTFKGNAISCTDFETIKENNKELYQALTEMDCCGYCYGICFHLLESLKKGEIKFVAIRNVLNEDHNNYYTMHVLYINNGWCFDTYSQKQHPLDEHLKLYKAKEYKTFSYKDVQGKTYEQFRKEHSPALEEWCNQNDCWENWCWKKKS